MHHGFGASSDRFVEERNALVIGFINTEGTTQAIAQLRDLKVHKLRDVQPDQPPGVSSSVSIRSLKVFMTLNGSFFLNHSGRIMRLLCMRQIFLKV